MEKPFDFSFFARLIIPYVGKTYCNFSKIEEGNLNILVSIGA